jgi:hypothetical protein
MKSEQNGNFWGKGAKQLQRLQHHDVEHLLQACNCHVLEHGGVALHKLRKPAMIGQQ